MNGDAPLHVRLEICKPSDPLLESNHSTEGEQTDIGPRSPISQAIVTDRQVLCDVMGIAVASALIGPCRRLMTPDGRLLEPGVHLVISTPDETHALAILAQILETVKAAQIKRLEILSKIDHAAHQESIEEIKRRCKRHSRSDLLPDPAHQA